MYSAEQVAVKAGPAVSSYQWLAWRRMRSPTRKAGIVGLTAS